MMGAPANPQTKKRVAQHQSRLIGRRMRKLQRAAHVPDRIDPLIRRAQTLIDMNTFGAKCDTGRL